MNPIPNFLGPRSPLRFFFSLGKEMRNWKKPSYSNTEQLLKSRICHYLTRQGAVVYMYMRSAPLPGGKVYRSTFMPKGVPDLLACFRGLFLGIEVKRPDAPQKEIFPELKKQRKGVLSEDQKRELSRIQRAGGKILVAYSLDDVVHLVKALSNAPEAFKISPQLENEMERELGAESENETLQGENGTEI